MKISLAENIRKFRKERSLTQEQLAEAMCVSVGAVHKWETGLSTPEIGLIVNLANFFDTSVDLLLGYEMHDNRIDAVLGRLNRYFANKDTKGLEEAEQALVKYPNSFAIVYTCAKVYSAFGGQSGKKEWLRRALELYQISEKLIAQNDNHKVNLMTIQTEEAIIYYKLDDLKKAIDLMEKSNSAGVNDPLLGSLCTANPDGMEMAKSHLYGGLAAAICDLGNMVPGYVRMYVAEKQYDKALAYLDWVGELQRSLRIQDQPFMFEKIQIAFETCRAYIHIKSGKKKEAEAVLKETIEKGLAYDKAPDQNGGYLRFIDVSQPLVAYDILGDTALEAIDTMVKICDDKELTKLWEKIRK